MIKVDLAKIILINLLKKLKNSKIKIIKINSLKKKENKFEKSMKFLNGLMKILFI